MIFDKMSHGSLILYEKEIFTFFYSHLFRVIRNGSAAFLSLFNSCANELGHRAWTILW